MDKTVRLLIINSVMSLPFIILHLFKIGKVEIVLSVTIILWVVYKFLFNNENISNYSVMLAYSVMLILKETKIKPVSILASIFGLILLYSVGIIVSNGNIARLANNTNLVILICVIHYINFYDSYVEPPDIKKLYNLTKLDMIILDALFLPDPCLKTIQDRVLKKDIHCSKTYVKDRLQQFYDIFDIKSGGSRKTELVVRLVRLGYTP